jgi:hypothetical protein
MSRRRDHPWVSDDDWKTEQVHMKWKSKVMVNSATNTHAEIFMNRQQLEDVDAFKYLGVILTKDGCSTTKILTKLAITTSAMAKLSKI